MAPVDLERGGGGGVLQRNSAPCGTRERSEIPVGCNLLAGSRVDTWSSFIGSAFTGPSKANKHRRNRLQ